MKRDRFFYICCGAIFLVLTVIGFRNYIFGGRLFDGSPIRAGDAGGDCGAQVGDLRLVRAVLRAVPAHRHTEPPGSHETRLERAGDCFDDRGDWTICGCPLETNLEKNMAVFDWPARPFLLVMLTEIALYVVFVAIGVLNRKQPRIHRPMTLLARIIISDLRSHWPNPAG